MMNKRFLPRATYGFHLSILCSMLLMACVPLSAPEDASAPSPSSQSNGRQWLIETDAPNEATIVFEGERTVIEFRSPKGLGQAQLQLEGNFPAQPLTMQFHLKGLERLRITTPTVTLIAVLSSTDPKASIQELGAGDTADAQASALEPISADSPYWLDIQINATAANTIDVTIPAAFMAEAGEFIAIDWIDFYR